MVQNFADFHIGRGPLLAMAVHHGHELRPEVEKWIILDDATRRREEDPWTGGWTTVADSSIVVNRSRFEVDVNRPREQAVYRTPEAAWGLDVWHQTVPESIIEESLSLYDAFYARLRGAIDLLLQQHGRIAVLDLHSFNHRRNGPHAPPDDPVSKPDINIGTGTLNRGEWGRVVDRFQSDLAGYPFPGRTLDVRENVCFMGGQIPRWMHETYPGSVCALAIEVKKLFMDEWTGEVDEAQYAAVLEALGLATIGLREELAR